MFKSLEILYVLLEKLIVLVHEKRSAALSVVFFFTCGITTYTAVEERKIERSERLKESEILNAKIDRLLTDLQTNTLKFNVTIASILNDCDSIEHKYIVLLEKVKK